MTNRRTTWFIVLGLSLLGASGCADLPGDDSAVDEATAAADPQALTGCTLDNAVPLLGPNVSNRLGANACVAVISPLLPSWWQYSDGTARVQIANFDDQNPSENAFPLEVQWENTCGTEQGTVTYTRAWQQHELGHPSAQCSIVIKLGGRSTEDVLIFWGA